MEKLLENHVGGKYNKYYRMNGSSYIELAQQIQDSDMEVMYVSVDEGVERDMQSVSRHYGMEEFLNMSSYIESAAYDIRHLKFSFLGSLRDKTVIIGVGAKENPVVTLSSDENLEIDDILQKKNKGLGM